MASRLTDKKRQEHEERARRTALSIAEVDRVMHQEDLSSRDLYITNVHPDPAQPRRFYPEDEHELQELADSIRRNGLLQPISVRPDPSDPERFLIIVGERRWRASQVAGKTRIRAVVHMMDEYAVRAAQYAENNKRADVSDVSRARSLQAMYEEERKRGGGWAEVAAASGITRMHVNRLTSLLRLPEPVVELVDRRLLASAHGYELVRVAGHLPDEEIVRLAGSCRKPKRGEAFSRSVEGLREEVNEILAHVQRPRGTRADDPEGAGPPPASPGGAEALLTPSRRGSEWRDSPTPAAAAGETATDGATTGGTGAFVPGPSDGPEVGAPHAPHAAPPVLPESATPLATDATGPVRPHVWRVVQEIRDGLLEAEEVNLLREALA